MLNAWAFRRFIHAQERILSNNRRDLADPYYDRLRIFLNASNSETDRGRALVAASLIDEMLEEIIRSYLLPGNATNRLFGSPHAPLSSFSAKIQLCRSLALISAEEYRDIEIVRKIRNKLAHSVLCFFENDRIKDWGRSLKIGMSYLDTLPEGDKSRVDEPRHRFNMVTTSLVSTLYNRAHYVRQARVSEQSFRP